MTTGDWGLLQPVGAGTRDLAGDDQVLTAMVQVEAALLHAWGRVDGTSYEPAVRVLDAVAADPRSLDHDALVAGIARDGVAVVALVALLRDALAAAGAPTERLHAGATSQDLLDTALVLVARTTTARVRESLVASGSVLAALADTERAAIRVGHTLGRQAAPSTLGAQVAGWLDGITSAIEVIDGLRFPVQLGGAVGTGEQADRVAGRAGAITALRAGVATDAPQSRGHGGRSCRDREDRRPLCVPRPTRVVEVQRGRDSCGHRDRGSGAVSYTHLTLPTILLV